MSRFEDILEDCFIRLKSGEATVEDCLAQYPEYAEELHRLFVTATSLERGRAVRPSSTFKARGRAQLVAHMQARPRNRLGRWWSTLSPFNIYPAFSRAFNMAVGLAAILFLSVTTGTVLAQRALPGETLYGWKIVSEEIVQAIYPDSLAVDLIVSERRNQDLARVVSDPKAREVALVEYQEALQDLSVHTAPQSKEKISEALARQKANLDEAHVSVPELDHLLAVVEDTHPAVEAVRESDLQLDYQAATTRPGEISYKVRISNDGPLNLVTATLTSHLSPVETLVSVDSKRCAAAEDGTVTCTIANLQTGRPQDLTLTTRVDPCYSGVINNTATLESPEGVTNLNSKTQVSAQSNFTAPFPRPARVAYVQSDERSHSLGLVASTADPLNLNLHVHAAAPAWSPDGSKLAFFGEEGISELGGIYTAGNGLWLMNVAGIQSQNPRLLVGQDHIKSIAWSPDGSKLAFEVGAPGLPHEIRVVEARDGRELSHLPGEQPAWSPDSQHLIVKSCEPACGLWLIDLNGNSKQQVTMDGTDSYPAWSSDGRYLVFSSLKRANNWEIYRLDWTNKEIVRLTNRPGTDTTPVFGPCNQEIYLRTDQYGSWWITAMKVDGTDEYKVQEGVGSTSDWGLARPAVH